jgi:hypothetical protein
VSVRSAEFTGELASWLGATKIEAQYAKGTLKITISLNVYLTANKNEKAVAMAFEVGHAYYQVTKAGGANWDALDPTQKRRSENAAFTAGVNAARRLNTLQQAGSAAIQVMVNYYNASNKTKWIDKRLTARGE